MIRTAQFNEALSSNYHLFRCPLTHEPLFFTKGELKAASSGKRYKLFDGIPDFASATIAGNVKEKVQHFWNNCPNESIKSKSKIGSPEFYSDTEKERYEHHTDFDKPFLKDAVGFDNIFGKRILEVGCGIGMDAIQFARNDNDIYLIDLSLNSIKVALGRFQNEGYSAHAAVADSERLPFDAETFDVVYSYGVLHHSPDTQKSIQEIHRVLAKGGQAIIMLYAKWSANTLFRLFLHFGLIEKQFFKHYSWKRFLSEWTELQSKTEDSVNPMTQCFSIRECRKMFDGFRSIGFEKHYINYYQIAEAKYLLRFVPDRLKRKLPALLGWNIIIRGRK